MSKKKTSGTKTAPREGDIMRVKESGALVRLIMPENPNEEQVLVDKQGYVYVEPVEEIEEWYHISNLEKV